jgi:hypothetical protein
MSSNWDPAEERWEGNSDLYYLPISDINTLTLANLSYQSKATEHGIKSAVAQHY